MLRPFSSRMFPDQVVFEPAHPSTGLRGGQFPIYSERGATLPGYVETTTDTAQRIETAGAGSDYRPFSKTAYRVFTGTDPNVGLSRIIAVDDHVLWINQGMILQILEGPQPQPPLWLTQCVRVGSLEPINSGFVLIDDTGTDRELIDDTGTDRVTIDG